MSVEEAVALAIANLKEAGLLEDDEDIEPLLRDRDDEGR